MTEKLVTKCMSCLAIKNLDTREFVPYTDPRYKGLHIKYKGKFSHGVCDNCEEEKRAEISKELISMGKRPINSSYSKD